MKLEFTELRRGTKQHPMHATSHTHRMGESSAPPADLAFGANWPIPHVPAKKTSPTAPKPTDKHLRLDRLA
jgi:hypothetical protein